MPQIKNAVQKITPALPGFLSGVATGAVLYLANHILHLGIDDQIVSPLATAVVMSGVHLASGSKAAATVEADAEKVADNPVVDYLTKEISAQLSASSTLKTKLVSVALDELHNVEAQSALVKDVVTDAPKLEAAVKAAAAPAAAPAPAQVGSVTVVPGPFPAPAPAAGTVPGPSATLPPSTQP